MGGKSTAKHRRDWAERNPEKVVASRRRQKSRPEVKTREAARRHEKRYRESLVGHAPLVRYAKWRAAKRDLPFALPEDWKAEVTTCELCGLPFVLKDPMYAASIDRIDNALGYTPDNCRLILRGLNVFKNKHADETMMTVARALVETQSRR